VWFDCLLFQTISAGDHEIALFRIAGLRVLSDIRPLVFHRSRFTQLSADLA
jgi:flavin reductase (DIM6/NTAB) family NADH-FMN oxidoreductase RutF